MGKRPSSRCSSSVVVVSGGVCVTEYLLNVLDDLGLEPTDNIRTLLGLLHAPPDQYSELAEQAPQRLAGAVAALRRLKLTQ